MNKQEKSKYKRMIKESFTTTVSNPLELLTKQREELACLSTEFDTPARLGKLVIFFAEVTRVLYHDGGFEVYPISLFKAAYFKPNNYNYLTSIEDEEEAISETILLAVTTTTETIG